MSPDVVLVPEHWYLVRVFYAAGKPVTTVVQFVGIDADTDTPTFTGYEALGIPDRMEVIREVYEG